MSGLNRQDASANRGSGFRCGEREQQLPLFRCLSQGTPIFPGSASFPTSQPVRLSTAFPVRRKPAFLILAALLIFSQLSFGSVWAWEAGQMVSGSIHAAAAAAGPSGAVPDSLQVRITAQQDCPHSTVLFPALALSSALPSLPHVACTWCIRHEAPALAHVPLHLRGPPALDLTLV